MRPAPERHCFTRLYCCRISSLLLTIFFFCSNARGQENYSYYKPYYGSDRKTHSEFKKLLAASAADTSRVKYLVAIADDFLDQPGVLKADMDSVALYLKKALDLAIVIKSAKWQHNTLMEYGQFYAEIQDREQQRKIYERAIGLAKRIGDKKMEADSWYFYFNNYVINSEPATLVLALKRAGYALALYRETGNIIRSTYTLKNIADFHLQLGNYDDAEKELLQVIAVYKKVRSSELCFSYDLLSAVYNHKGELSNALYYALATFKSYKGNDNNLLGTFTRRVAEAYSAIGKKKESIAWYTRAYQLYDHSFIFVPTYELATQLVYDGQTKRALQLIVETRKKYPVQSDPYLYCIDLAYAETYTALGQFQLAAPHFKQLMAMAAKDTAEAEINTLIFFHLGEYYFAQNQYAKARYFLDKALLNKVYVTLLMRSRIYKILYHIDMANGNASQAIIHLQEFHKFQDSIFSQEKLNTIERLQIEFNATQKENENEILRRKSQLQSQMLKQAELVKKSTIAGIIFLCIVLLLLYNRFNLKKRVHNILMTQKKAIDIAYSRLEASVQQKNKLIDDKERLIKEVHHRVKNNLQLTMSLLNTQSHYLEDPSAIAAIKESQHRLKSIALIHQKLYQTEDVSAININLYIAELVNYLQDSLGDGRMISFELNLCNLEMDIGLAVPLGLFLNEAITNIFKYAFSESEGGTVKINLSPQPDNWFLLEIKDNGKGLSAGFDYQNSKTLGMTLMKGLSSQIEGELFIKSKQGLSIRLLFENHLTFAEEKG